MTKILPQVGLCVICQHQKLVASARGSQFVLCQLAKEDNRFAKYPPLPVLSCAGFKRRTQIEESNTEG